MLRNLKMNLTGPYPEWARLQCLWSWTGADLHIKVDIIARQATNAGKMKELLRNQTIRMTACVVVTQSGGAVDRKSYSTWTMSRNQVEFYEIFILALFKRICIEVALQNEYLK